MVPLPAHPHTIVCSTLGSSEWAAREREGRKCGLWEGRGPKAVIFRRACLRSFQIGTIHLSSLRCCCLCSLIASIRSTPEVRGQFYAAVSRSAIWLGSIPVLRGNILEGVSDLSSPSTHLTKRNEYLEFSPHRQYTFTNIPGFYGIQTLRVTNHSTGCVASL
ncbi:hypothetical protein TNCV_2281151 [Trichonephila clavipes]|nr:hypothetical protein TNCV_2281151 [Trichonephila clavipes]